MCTMEGMAAITRAPRPDIGPLVAHLMLMRWLLAAAYLPALTFFGHWPLSVDIPGTSLYVGLPESTTQGAAHNHKDHCHADAGSCSDTPVTTAGTVALLAESLAIEDLDSPLIGMATGFAAWQPQAGVARLLPPPERSFTG